MKSIYVILSAIYAFSTVAIASGVADDKIVKYHDNGSKSIEKQYKNGLPIGEWRSWYPDGKIKSIIEFQNISVEGYPPKHQMVHVETRYADNYNGISFKGTAFPAFMADVTNPKGHEVVMPGWTFLYQNYYNNKQHEPVAQEDKYKITIIDEKTGNKYSLPWDL